VSTNTAEVGEKSAEKIHAPDWISGFLVLGVLVGLLGSLVIAWQYHIDVEPQLIGMHFLALSTGYVVAAIGAQRLLVRYAIRTMAIASCGTGFGSLLALSFLAPPMGAGWRILGIAFMGLAAGALATALFYALERQFVIAAAATANRAGVLFGSGCLLATLIVGLTYFAGSIQIETALLSLVPLIFLFLYAANKHPIAARPVGARKEDPIRETLRDLRSIAAVLFSLLLFFQFGNEWAIAGWLPLFLIHRLGTNPVWAISALALYFFCLMMGRLIATRLLRILSHRHLLWGSMLAAMAGYLLLSFASVFWLACVAVVLIGAGFAPIYPLVAEKLDERFSFHPGFYNGIFSLAVTGAMGAPWLLGYVASSLGMHWVMLLPALGSILVVILALLITLEAHVMGGPKKEIKLKAASAAGGE